MSDRVTAALGEGDQDVMNMKAGVSGLVFENWPNAEIAAAAVEMAHRTINPNNPTNSNCGSEWRLEMLEAPEKNFASTVAAIADDSDHALLKAARELGCNDPLVQQLADRLEALRGGMSAIGMSPSLNSCHLIATQSLKGH